MHIKAKTILFFFFVIANHSRELLFRQPSTQVFVYYALVQMQNQVLFLNMADIRSL